MLVKNMRLFEYFSLTETRDANTLEFDQKATSFFPLFFFIFFIFLFSLCLVG